MINTSNRLVFPGNWGCRGQFAVKQMVLTSGNFWGLLQHSKEALSVEQSSKFLAGELFLLDARRR